MKKAVHFGAGNIGRGFIGEILFENGFEITFVDVNERIIDALNERGSYEIEIAEEGERRIAIHHVKGINSAKSQEEVVDALSQADLVTTAIGPHILPFIAEVIAKGIERRQAEGKQEPLDIIACENMIGGSAFLCQEVEKYLSPSTLSYAHQWIGFPNAAVDRIVPAQSHEDPLFVRVEPFSEWVVETVRMKNPALRLSRVHYEERLEPFIERKLFSVNTGHATTAYLGASYGAATILEALQNEKVKSQVEAVLAEIRQLLISKWQFDEEALKEYHKVILGRFENPYIVDDIARVARTPIRKLGYDERFIRPIRELKERGLSYQALLDTLVHVFHYKDESDEQSVQLQEWLKNRDLRQVVTEVTGLKQEDLIQQITAILST